MDYSKWDNLDVDEEEDGPARPRVTRLAGPSTFTIGTGGRRAPPPAAQRAPAAGVQARVTDYARWEEVAKGMSDEEEGGEEDDIDGGTDEHDEPPGAGERPGLGLASRAGAPAAAAAPQPPAPRVTAVAASASTHGGVTERYVWSQTKSEVTLNVVVPAGTRARDVRVRVDRDFVGVALAGSDFALEGTLAHAVAVDEDPDEIDWELRQPDGAAVGRWLRLTLAKQCPAGVVIWWDRVFAGDEPVDISAFAGRDGGRAAQFEANWNEAHALFLEKVASRRKVEI